VYAAHNRGYPSGGYAPSGEPLMIDGTSIKAMAPIKAVDLKCLLRAYQVQASILRFELLELHDI
jgi:hypothetical protein